MNNGITDTNTSTNTNTNTSIIIDHNDNNGTNNNRFNTFDESSNNKIYIDGNEEKNNEFTINIYRYKFTNEFMEHLFVFSKIHQYDKREDFKEAWEKWVNENSDIVDIEIRRVLSLGYNGDTIDKMYKSARYYFRKKSTEKKEPKNRRVYINIQKEFLNEIDKHILQNINNKDYKPSDAFTDFCKDHVDILREEVNVLIKNGIKNSNEIKEKIKKTYKNRYFILTNNKIINNK